jgi:ribonuclease J
VPDIPSLLRPDGNTALIISHAHQDHYGLISYINKSCPVYLGKSTMQIIELSDIFCNYSGHNLEINNPQFFESGKTFTIGDFEITPYLMDHSAFDAYAFLVKAEGGTLFYSGDFRTHGRKAKAFG